MQLKLLIRPSYHVNIKLVQTAKRRLCDGPERQDKANGGEGALASRQGAHVAQVSRVSLTRLDLKGSRKTEPFTDINHKVLYRVQHPIRLGPSMTKKKNSHTFILF